MQRKSIKSLAVVVTVLSLAVMLGAQTAFASNGGPNTPRQVGGHANLNVPRPFDPGDSEGNSNCQYSSSDVNCDGYDVGLSNCGPNNGAYWVGAYSGEITFVEVWWSPKCHSNYIYSYVPSNLNTCGGYTCNAVAEAWINRTTYSSGYCNYDWGHSYNNDYCENDAGSHRCQTPGNCGTVGAQLYYCDAKANNPPHVNCYSNTTFNGEFIGSGSQWWSSFETDMLYSPNNPVQGCVFFVNTSYPGIESPAYCTMWH